MQKILTTYKYTFEPILITVSARNDRALNDLLK